MHCLHLTVTMWGRGLFLFILSVKESMNNLCFIEVSAAIFWLQVRGGLQQPLSACDACPSVAAPPYKSVSYSLDVKCNQTAHSESNLHLTQFLQQRVPALLRSLFCPLSIRSVSLSGGGKKTHQIKKTTSFAYYLCAAYSVGDISTNVCMRTSCCSMGCVELASMSQNYLTSKALENE